MRSAPRRFNGSDYDPARDTARLSRQLGKVYTLMTDGQWRTLHDIATTIEEPEASVSAQLRHLRKPRFGGYRVNKRHLGHGLFEYQLLPPVPSRQLELFEGGA